MPEGALVGSHAGHCPAQLVEDHNGQVGGHASEVVDDRVDGLIAELLDEAGLPVLAEPRRVEGIDERLHLQVGHGVDKIGNRWTNPSQWLHDRFSHVDGTVVAESDGGNRCAIRQLPQATGPSKFIRSRLGDLMEDVENLSCLSKRIDQPACQHGSNRVETEFQGGGDPEVGTGASQSPEEVWVLVGTDRHEVALSRDQIDGEEVITGQPVLSHQPAESATEGKSRDAGRGDQAPRGCQAEDAGLTVKLAPRHPSLSPNGVLRRIDANTFHGGEVNDHAAVDKCSPRNVVAAAAHSQEDAMRAGKVDSVDDVGNSGTL